MSKKYQKIPGKTGIRKCLTSGNYEANKTISGKRYTSTFQNLRDATKWRREFSPLDAKSLDQCNQEVRKNGRERKSLREALELYRKYHVDKLALSSRDAILFRIECFFNAEILDFQMNDIDSRKIDDHVERLVERQGRSSKRYNFDLPLKTARSFFNWYKDNYDDYFVNPVKSRHFVMGVVKDRREAKREKGMNQLELAAFWKSFDDIYFRDIAIVQFYCGARIGEIAGLLKSELNAQEKSITIKRTLVWGRNSQFTILKDSTKNGEKRKCHLPEKIFSLILSHCEDSSSDHVFYDKKKRSPLSYRKLQYHFNKALKKAGLYGKYSSTHIMRHSMGSITREVTGSIDCTQAVTGHKSVKMAEHYGVLPSKTQQIAVEKVFSEIGIMKK